MRDLEWENWELQRGLDRRGDPSVNPCEYEHEELNQLHEDIAVLVRFARMARKLRGEVVPGRWDRLWWPQSRREVYEKYWDCDAEVVKVLGRYGSSIQ